MVDVPAEVLDWLMAGDPAIRWQVLRDLRDAPAEEVARERARVAREGWGRRLLDLQHADGTWAGGAFVPAGFTREAWQAEGQPWTATFPTLMLLLELGVDPLDPAVVAAVDRVADQVRWDEGGQRFFEGETEPCINGRVVRLGAEHGRDVGPVVDRLLDERLADGGWNCRAPAHSHVTSFDTTINVLEGLQAWRRRADAFDRLDEAIAEAEAYLLDRALFRRRTTGEVADPGFLELSFPTEWHHDVLRALDYLRSTGRPPDPRCAEALDHVAAKRGEDGRWRLDRVHRGRVHFAMEAPGEPSRWITLRALRVLRWADQRGSMSS